MFYVAKMIITCLCLNSLKLTAGLHVTVLTYGLSKESPGTNSVAYVAPAIKLGIQEIERLYGFNISHVLLTNPGILSCDDEWTHMDMVSNFYYSRSDPTSLFVIIFAGCDSNIPLSRMSKGHGKGDRKNDGSFWDQQDLVVFLIFLLQYQFQSLSKLKVFRCTKSLVNLIRSSAGPKKTKASGPNWVKNNIAVQIGSVAGTLNCLLENCFVLLISCVVMHVLKKEWNTLLITSAGTFPEIRNKTLHPTAISMIAVNYLVYVQAFLSMFAKFSWTKVMIIYESWEKNDFHMRLAKAMHAFQTGSTSKFKLDTIPINSGIVIVLGFHATIVRTFMLTASRLGMTDHNYVYMSYEPFPALRRYGNLLTPLNDGFDEVARKAYHQLFKVSVCDRKHNLAMMTFVQQLRKDNIRDYNATFLPEEQPSEIAIMTYFATRSFGQVLNETYYSRDSVYDGFSMAKRFHNRTFLFDVGSISLDYTGERLPDYCFKRLVPETMGFEDVLYYNYGLQTIVPVGSASVVWDTPTGSVPPSTPVCGFSGTSGPCTSAPTLLLVIIPVSLLIIGITILFTLMMRAASVQNDNWWEIGENDFEHSSLNHKNKLISLSSASHSGKLGPNIRYFHGVPVTTSRVRLRKPFLPNKLARIALSEVKRIGHDNIVRLLGLCIQQNTLTIVHELSQKGDLTDALEKVQLDWNDRLSFVNDLIEGLFVIHASFFKRHGQISPFTLYINKRLTLQLGDVGIFDILRDSDFTSETEMDKSLCEIQSRWTAPELKMFLAYLDNRYLMARYAGPEADIYSFGAVVNFMHGDCPGLIYPENDRLSSLAASCLMEIPADRPTIAAVRKKFAANFSSCRGIAQNFVSRMEAYAEKLEFSVAERTRALIDERRLCVELLAEMLPSTVVNKLLNGSRVDAEKFDSVTVLFSYIIGFLGFVTQFTETPGYVVMFLNQVFTSFDQLLNRHTYKVETISDTYMVVSGLPVPNGDRHAPEVCELAVHLMRTFSMLNQLHVPVLEISVGIHTGPCAAGVVGHKRPRYCLFGDTVNTASRLATHGIPSKIHISNATATLIKNHPTLTTTIRGIVCLKGIGNETTHWLQDDYMQI